MLANSREILLVVLIIFISSFAEAGITFGPSSTVALMKEVEIVERHMHSAGSWFGAAASPSATNKADRIGPGIAAFSIDAGNQTWGSWVQIFGSDDTPARTGKVYFDPHLILITAAEREAVYFIQVSRGESGNTTNMTELAIDIDDRKKFTAAIPFQTGRAPAGALLWARCLAIGFDTGTLNFYLGVHEYDE